MKDYSTELDRLLDVVVKENASDFHLSVGRTPTLRVAGALVPLVKESPLEPQDTHGFMKAILSDDERERFVRDKEIDLSYSHKGDGRFRINCFIQRGYVGIAMRLIPKDIRTIEELRLPPVLKDFAYQQQGFFLVVGPVGQGKTTTLAALIELINQERSEHIITIEDPIEYIFEQKKSMIDQREVLHDTNSFERGLKSVFRQDVDVVLIGEMRNAETMATAVTAAETGHLIYSTLHTNSASQTVDRIIDAFPAAQQAQIRTQLASSLSGIFSQRLVPSTSGGVVPAYELLINNDAVGNLIRESRTHELDSVIQTSAEQGMIDINRSLAELVRNGEISLEMAHDYSPRPQMLDKFM